MDIMDIQAVESKLSDVTVTPIPRSQVQNFYNYQAQREQREQQPQIQISAIHHNPRERNNATVNWSDHQSNRDSNNRERERQRERQQRELYAKREREREYQQPAAAVAAANMMALQQYMMLMQQAASAAQNGNSSNSATFAANSNATATATSSSSTAASKANSNNNNNNANSHNNSYNNNSNASPTTPSQLKYPQSNSPLIVTTQQSANITTPMTSTANLPSMGSLPNTNGLTKYAQLLATIEEMSRDIRPTYTGSRSSTERLKRGIQHARSLIRDCLMETERSARQ